MKKKISLVTLFSLFFIPIALAQTVDQYPYKAQIEVPAIDVSKSVGIELDENVLEVVGDTLHIAVVEQGSKKFIPFGERPITSFFPLGSSAEASSTREPFRNETYDAANMVDRDGSTYWSSASRPEKEITIKLTPVEPIYTNGVDFIMGDESGIPDRVRVSIDDLDGNKKIVIEKAKPWMQKSDPYVLDFEPKLVLEHSLTFPPVKAKTLYLTFEYEEDPQPISFREVVVSGAPTPRLYYFSAEPGKSYELLYGGEKKLNYQDFYPDIDINTPTATVSNHQANPQYRAPNSECSDGPDLDGDGVSDSCDNCKLVKNSGQVDSDEDGVGDACDNCVNVKNPDQLDRDANGIGWACDDIDNDGVLNSKDNCEEIVNADQADRDRNGFGDICEDADGDGILAENDNCMYDANADQVDQDEDGIGDMCDNCPSLKNSLQEDFNQNGVGDLCEDNDNDGIADSQDNCPEVSNNDQSDVDNDGVGDICDNCKDVLNPDQRDVNKDGVGDICADEDGDGLPTNKDNCPDIANPDQKDQNQNFIGDACEDNDNDGIRNGEDNCPAKANYSQKDSDADGIGDECDNSDDRWTESQPALLWAFMVLVIGVLAAIMWKTAKKA